MSETNKIDRTIDREIKTVRHMTRIYCKAHHDTDIDICGECRGLLEYTESRIGKCPQIERKPPCRRCTIHCFRPDYRKMIHEVMRFSGPRMMYRHPILALMHLMKR